MKKISLLLAIILVAVSLAACGDNSDATSSAVSSAASSAAVSSAPVSSEEKVNDYSAVELTMYEAKNDIKVQGRSVPDGTGITLDNTGNSLLFNADCEGTVAINLTVLINDYAKSEEFFGCYFTVYVDGELTQPRAKVTGDPTKQVKTDLVLAEGLTRGEHTFEVYKQSANWLVGITVNSIKLNGELTERPADNKVLIDFVGDSITEGYGNIYTQSMTADMKSQECEDGMQTYATLTARALGVDYSITAAGGATIAESMESYVTATTRRSTRWGFERKADIVVINLGTNDNNQLSNTQMQNAATAMLELVKQKNPDAKIVWAYGLMGDGKSAQIKAALEAAGGEAAGYYYCSLPYNGDGGGAHPSVEGHKAAADVLTNFIKGIM
jgi:hypothetical protein